MLLLLCVILIIQPPTYSVNVQDYCSFYQEKCDFSFHDNALNSHVQVVQDSRRRRIMTSTENSQLAASHRRALLVAVAATCSEAGFTAGDEDCLETLAEIMQSCESVIQKQYVISIEVHSQFGVLSHFKDCLLLEIQLSK